MKIRPVSSSFRRRRSTENTTPSNCKKKDILLLMSASNTADYVDTQVYTLAESVPMGPSKSFEISQQLGLLKIHTNSTHISRNAITSKARRLSVELSNTVTAKKVCIRNLETLQNDIENIRKNIKNTQINQEIFLSDREIYLHMKERLLETKIFLDMRKVFLDQKLKNSEFVVIEADRIRVKTSEERCRSAKVYKEVNRTFAFFTKKNNEFSDLNKSEKRRIDGLEADRKSRLDRQLEIQESTRVNEKNRTEIDLRNGVLLHKLWFEYLTKKMNENVLKFSNIDMAFRKIKSVSGIQDINEIAMKFLTRENNLDGLMSVIRKNKATLELFSQRNVKIQNKIKDIMITERNAFSACRTHKISSEIMLNSLRNLEEKKTLARLAGLHSRIGNWIKKNIFKFNSSVALPSQHLQELMQALQHEVKLRISTKSIQNDNFSYHSSVFITEKPIMPQRKQLKVEVSDLSELFYDSNSDSEITSQKKGKKH